MPPLGNHRFRCRAVRPGRPAAPGQAWELLARSRLRREVSRGGRASMYHRLICFAPGEALKRYAGGWAYAGPAAASGGWVIADLEGRELHRRPAPQLSREAITPLRISNS